jgi:hypothetical protein
MLKFDEAERPSFVELGKLVLTSTENSLDSPKGTNAKPGIGKRNTASKGLGQPTSVERNNKSLEN